MGITVEYLTGLGVENEIAEKIFAERGKEIQAEKAKSQKTADELKTTKESLSTITAELDTLKASNASAEDWKNKYETLDREVKEAQAQREKEQQEAQRIENLTQRYNAVCVDDKGNERKWTHDAIKESYKNKFFEEVSKPENQGKADKDIFYQLTKDDATAFVNVERGVLHGAAPIDTKENSLDMARAVMGLK